MSQIQKKPHRAVEALATATAEYPEAWKKAELFRQVNGQPGQLSWPAWCYLPLGGWYAIVARARHDGREIRNLASLLDVSRLAALGAWRMTQGIYRFDPALLATLQAAQVAADVPCDALYRLPQWCVYLETPGIDGGLHGVWAHLEQDAKDSRPELRLLLDEDNGLTPVVLQLGPWSLQEALQRAVQDAEREAAARKSQMPGAPTDAARHTSRIVPPILSMLLHLCSDAAAFSQRGKPGRPAMPELKRTKQGDRLFPASGPTEWLVAVM